MNQDQIKQFIIAVRTRSRAEMNTNTASRKSEIRLIIQLNAALWDKSLRDPVLAAITGLRITSQDQLTQGSTSVMIDETNNGKSDEILRAIEEEVAAGFAKGPIRFRPFRLYPWESPNGK